MTQEKTSVKDTTVSEITPGPVSPEKAQQQKRKNYAMAVAILLFCALIYVVSIIKMSGGAA